MFLFDAAVPAPLDLHRFPVADYPMARPPHVSWMPVMNWLLTAEPLRLARPIVVIGCARVALFNSPAYLDLTNPPFVQ
jgi:hypothetical protein